jgi:hypothetical protein
MPVENADEDGLSEAGEIRKGGLSSGIGTG